MRPYFILLSGFLLILLWFSSCTNSRDINNDNELIVDRLSKHCDCEVNLIEEEVIYEPLKKKLPQITVILNYNQELDTNNFRESSEFVLKNLTQGIDYSDFKVVISYEYAMKKNNKKIVYDHVLNNYLVVDKKFKPIE